jgi:hypothetical protein
MGKQLGLWSGGNRGEIGAALPAGEGETVGDDEADRCSEWFVGPWKLDRAGLLGPKPFLFFFFFLLFFFVFSFSFVSFAF